MHAGRYLCILFLIGVQLAESTFSRGFQNFLRLKYGSAAAKNLTRTDLGENGSFGGGTSSLHLFLKHDPVIFVHGLNSQAGDFLNTTQFFVKSGYKREGLFATSYGPNGVVVSGADSMSCDWFKQIRRLITAVSKYTGRKVVVAGYSLGSAMARKSILGGKCPDRNENLGSPLTHLVRAYLSVAGANIGALLCNFLPTAPMCGNTAGFAKNSLFLQDLNHRQHYEAKSLFMVGSTTDEVVGFENETLPASDANVTFNGFDHLAECFNTLHTQFSLISKGYVSQQTIDTDAEAQSELTGTNCTGSVEQRRHWPSHGDSNERDDGHFDERSGTYIFESGYAYRHYDRLTNKQFHGRGKLW